jgi:xanthine dehydrogenase YagT iron-sulfur-binding subunit
MSDMSIRGIRGIIGIRGTPIAVGMAAPSFVLHDDARRRLSSSETRGRPWVLAFARRWTPGADAGAIRAQLRGLGAILFVASDAGVWSFRPDDDIELSAGASARLRRELDELGARCGVDAGDDGVFVVDGDGIVRFAHAPCGELTTSLGSALEAAGRELLGLPPRPGITRRDWAVMSLVAGFGLVLLSACRARGPEGPAPAPPRAPAAAGTEVDLVLRINGQDRKLRIDPRVSLLDALREHLALTGARKGCDHGQCGACTVLRDGRAVNACLTLALAAEGAEITTIEGLAKGDKLHPLQAAFITHDAFQCGYCTSGQIMAGVAVLTEGRARTDDEVRQQMSGNICRCGAYPNIIAAIQTARKEVWP